MPDDRTTKTIICAAVVAACSASGSELTPQDMLRMRRGIAAFLRALPRDMMIARYGWADDPLHALAEHVGTRDAGLTE